MRSVLIDHPEQLKSQQDELERKLWEEREAIHSKHTEKVKVANTK